MNLRTYEIETPLRDGTPVKIRLMDVKDGPGQLEFFRSLPEEDRLFLRDDVTRPEWLDRFIHLIDYNTMVPLVAEANGQVVGHATLQRNVYGWSTHVGEIRVAVARRCQGKGLATIMIRELVKIAIDEGLEKLVASVVDNQMCARRAFERIGFRAEAVLKGHVKDIRGAKRNLVVLANDVSHIWEAMEALTRDYSPSLE